MSIDLFLEPEVADELMHGVSESLADGNATARLTIGGVEVPLIATEITCYSEGHLIASPSLVRVTLELREDNRNA